MESIGARDTLTIVGAGAGTTFQSYKNIALNQINKFAISNCTIEKNTDKWGLLVFSSSASNGVYTVSNCIFNSATGDQCIYINQSVAATFNIENCTFNAADNARDGVITIQNNPGVDFTINVTGCEFNTNNREIYLAPATGQTEVYEGWTLNNPDNVPVYTFADNP